MSPENKISLVQVIGQEYRRLKTYTRRLQRDMSDLEAEDIIQDVVLNLFSRVDFETPIENLVAYLYRSVRNRIIDLQRKRKNRIRTSLTRQIMDTEQITEPAEEDGGPDREHLYEIMNRLMETIPPESREVLLATEYEGRSFRELSEESGIPAGTLLSRKHRAIALLQNAFREQYPDEWNEYFND